MPQPSHQPPEHQRGQVRTPHCLHCGYLLEGVPDGRCPECGHQAVYEGPDALGRRLACGKFGGVWRYARAFFFAMIAGWMLNDWFRSTDVGFLAVFAPALLIAMGIAIIFVAWFLAWISPEPIRTPVFCATSDVLQWLVWIPILGLMTSGLGSVLDDTIPLDFRHEEHRRTFCGAASVTLLMPIGFIAIWLMHKRWPVIAVRTGLPKLVIQAGSVHTSLLVLSIFVGIFISIVTLLSIISVFFVLQYLR